MPRGGKNVHKQKGVGKTITLTDLIGWKLGCQRKETEKCTTLLEEKGRAKGTSTVKPRRKDKGMGVTMKE